MKRRMVEMAALETVNGSGITLEIKGQELQDLCALFDEWTDLRQQVKPDCVKFDDLDLQGLLHILVITGRDIMQREVLDFKETFEARAYMEGRHDRV